MRNEYYVILTKYGFIRDVEEDYTDLIESNPLWKLYNVTFVDNPSRAIRFSNKDEEAPKYACSEDKSPWEMTVEEWINEIGGEIVKLTEYKYTEVIFKNGETVFQEINKYIVDKDLADFKFELFPYDDVEDKTIYE